MYLTQTKLKNALKRIGYFGLVEFVDCHNVNVNGRRQGFTGFIQHRFNSRIVYICTDCLPFIGQRDNLYYRYAPDFTYSGHGNNVSDTDLDVDALAARIVRYLENDTAYARQMER